MSPLDRILAGGLWLLAVLFIAGIIHIVAIFALPSLTPNETLARLAKLAEGAAQPALLPPPTPEAQAAPFIDPALAQGVCLFDLSRGELRLRGDVNADKLLTLSFLTSEGLVFYSMTEKAAQRGKLEVLVLNAAQLENLEAESDAQDEDEEPTPELRLVSPAQKGFILISALADLPSARPEAEKRIKAISCQTEQPAQD